MACIGLPDENRAQDSVASTGQVRVNPCSQRAFRGCAGGAAGRLGRAVSGFFLVAALAFAQGAAARGSSWEQSGDNAADVPVGTVNVGELPREAVATLGLIGEGGPYPYEKDGVVFGNFERQLPHHRRGFYHEYTVPTPHARNRGARRIVCGGPLRHTDNCYYSDDHYASFKRIVE
jgi:ribonuclease T1